MTFAIQYIRARQSTASGRLLAPVISTFHRGLPGPMSNAHRQSALVALVAALLPFASSIGAQQRATPLDSATLASLSWRNIGPADMGGRIADIVGIPSPSKTFYVASVAGGMWKTTNAGTTFRPVFGDQRVISMGALAIAPSDTNQVWAGTGEPNSRNSISPGAGIYKSNDGGMTWNSWASRRRSRSGASSCTPPTRIGVRRRARPRVGFEPGARAVQDHGRRQNLAADQVRQRQGRLRRCRDGSARSRTSCMRRAMSACVARTSSRAADRVPRCGRAPMPAKRGRKSRAADFPETMKGRISVAISRSNPTRCTHSSKRARARTGSVPHPRSDPQGEGATRSLTGCIAPRRRQDVEAANDDDTRPFYYSQVRVDPKNPRSRVLVVDADQVSHDGGKTTRNTTQQRARRPPRDVDRSERPGAYRRRRRRRRGADVGQGGNFDSMNKLPIGQYYKVTLRLWPCRTTSAAARRTTARGAARAGERGGTITNSYWYTIHGGDGFYTAQDPTNPNIVYGESQGGNNRRLRTSRRASGSNFAKPSGSRSTSSGKIRWPSSAAIRLKPETKEMAKSDSPGCARSRSRTRSISTLRFNWNSPYLHFAAQSRGDLFRRRTAC